MFQGRTTTSIEAPARGPLDYNALKPSFGQLAPLFGLTLITLLPIGIGAVLFYVSTPGEHDISGMHIIGMTMGALFALAGVRFFWPLSATIPDAVKQYYSMVYAWHNAELDKFEASDGKISAVQVSEWTYTQTDIRHVAALAFYLMLEQPRSLSIEQLTRGGLFVRSGHRAFKLLDFTQDGAAAALDLCASAGLITGRAPRKAGQLAVVDWPTAGRKLLAQAAANPATIGSQEA
jgi:hypothetical protein